MKGRECVGLAARLTAKSASSSHHQNLTAMNSDEESEEENMQDVSHHNEEGARMDDGSNDESGEAGVVKPKKKKSKRKHDEEYMSSLTSHREASLTAIQDLRKQLEESQMKSQREGWITWLCGVAREVPDDRWETFQDDTYQLFKTYVKKADKTTPVDTATAEAGSSQQYQPPTLQVPLPAQSIVSQGHLSSPAVTVTGIFPTMGQSAVPPTDSLQPAQQSNQNQYNISSLASNLENNLDNTVYNYSSAPF